MNLGTTATWPEWMESGAWHSQASALPLMPGLLANVMDVALDADIEGRRLIRLVAREQVLAASVLRLANTAANAPLGTVTTVEQAVWRLGTRAVRSAVLSICFATWSERASSKTPQRLGYVEHGIGTACLAGLVADRSGVNAEEAFVGGLLHDIGKLFLLNLRTVYIRSGGRTPTADEEDTVFRQHHAEVGGVVMESWTLPPALREPVRWHHEPFSAPTCPQTAAVVYAANRLSHRFGFGCTRTREDDILEDPVCIALGVDPSWLRDIDTRAPVLFDAACQFVVPAAATR